MVTRLYSSFLMRLWCLEGDELRIKIEHIQSGEVVQVETFNEALVWVEVRAQGPPTQSESREEWEMER